MLVGCAAIVKLSFFAHPCFAHPFFALSLCPTHARYLVVLMNVEVVKLQFMLPYESPLSVRHSTVLDISGYQNQYEDTETHSDKTYFSRKSHWHTFSIVTQGLTTTLQSLSPYTITLFLLRGSSEVLKYHTRHPGKTTVD